MKKCLVLGLVLTLSIGSAIAEDSIDLTHPQQVRIKNEERAQVSLSSQDINKIYVDNDKITAISAPHGRLTSNNDSSGSLYLTVNGEAPFTCYISTEKERHFSLWVIPKSIPVATIEFKSQSREAIHINHHTDAGRAYESSSPYQKTLVNLLKSSMNNEVPPGYASISPKAFSQVKCLQLINDHTKHAKIKQSVVAGYLGGDLAVRIIEVKNKTRHALTLSEQGFYSPMVRAVAISQPYLGGHQVTYVYEVVSNV